MHLTSITLFIVLNDHYKLQPNVYDFIACSVTKIIWKGEDSEIMDLCAVLHYNLIMNMSNFSHG